jgi:AAA15 family ATPase/GTPase
MQETQLAIFRGSSYATKETNVKSAVKKLFENSTKEKGSIALSVEENNTCYWIRQTYDGEQPLLQINKYETETGKCLGIPKDQEYIKLNKNLNMLSSIDCLCSGNSYLLEWKTDGLKISKR